MIDKVRKHPFAAITLKDNFQNFATAGKEHYSQELTCPYERTVNITVE